MTIGDSTMGDLSISASSFTRASQPCGHLGSVVQALRCNSSSTLPVVRHGSECFFLISQNRVSFPEPDEGGQPDVMNQLVAFEVRVEQGKDCVDFAAVWDGGNQVSIALLEAMQTNNNVRSLELAVDYLEESHLTAIVGALLKNDTLQSFSVWADYASRCPIQAVRAAFERILERNMCLRKLHVGPFDIFDDDNDSFASPRLTVGFIEGGDRLTEGFIEDELAWSGETWQVDLGATVTEAIERNCQAFAVAEALGRVSRSSMHCNSHLGDFAFRRQLLLFFLQEGCQPPRMMLYVAKGLPQY